MTKNTSYHYSIIIPHKNTPRLLERCLCSIPTWMKFKSLSLMTTATPNLSIFLIFRETAEKYGNPVH